MECLAVKFTAAAHNFLGIGRRLFLVLRQVLNCSLTSLSQISKELVLDYCTLKKRAAIKNKDSAATMSPADFIEINLEPPAAITECIVEMQDIAGAKPL